MRRSNSAWAANCAVVTKTDGTARVCQYWRGLNALLEPNNGRFRDARGDLWEFNRCGIGLTSLRSVIAVYMWEALGPLTEVGVQYWLDDVITRIGHVDVHVVLLEQILARLHQYRLPVNLAKSRWCTPQQEFVGMVVLAGWAFSRSNWRCMQCG